MSNSLAKRIPRPGDRVDISGLKGAPQHNGKSGIVKSFVEKEQRFSVDLGDSTILGLKLYNITVAEPQDRKEAVRMHLFIPCHIDSERRLRTFKSCAKSAVGQIMLEYNIYVGLSGPATYRSKALATLVNAIRDHTQTNVYVLDDKVEKRPQMEHLRSLLERGSMQANPKALITFLDNDDMCHPIRLFKLMDAYHQAPSLGEPFPLALTPKLLLDPSIAPSEGSYKHFVDPNDLMDFTKWQRHPILSRKVQMATAEEQDELDCAEYFDFLVPSEILQKFMKLTPPEVAANRFCDLRLFQVLDYLEPGSMSGCLPPDTWFIAHYKIPMDDKLSTFDNHGERDAGRLKHAMDQASFVKEDENPQDLMLSERYPLSPAQVAMCRSHIESIILSVIGWNETFLDRFRGEKIAELNRAHGHGFGDELWRQCYESMLALFDSETLEASKNAWRRQGLW